jgi:predicted kinase
MGSVEGSKHRDLCTGRDQEAVPRLILLNGPPGIGKSTLAQLYADDHPGVLNLDIDRVRALIGGWLDRFAETGEIVRPIAVCMAATHLRGGRDVVMPQCLCRLSEVERVEKVARDSGAVFCEVVLMDTKEGSLERFNHRGENRELPWHRQVQEIVERGGGQVLLARMHDQLTAVLAARPNAVVVPSAAGAIQQTYEALTAILDPTP